jgi:hypothetical protein
MAGVPIQPEIEQDCVVLALARDRVVVGVLLTSHCSTIVMPWCSLRPAFNSMRADPPENVRIAFKGECEAISTSDPRFPDLPAFGVSLPFHFLGPQGPVTRVCR